jgi:hypothetical protein
VRIPLYRNGARLENDAYTFSIMDFVNLAQEKGGAKLKAFTAKLGNYTEYARKYFGVDTDIDFTLSPLSATVENLTPYGYHKTTAFPEGIHYKEMTLLMQEDTSLRLYFTLDSGHEIGEYAFKIDGKGATAYTGTDNHAGQYYVEVSNIPATDLGNPHTISVGDAEFTNVSALSYSYLALSQNVSENLQNAAKALYEYNQAAIVYFS